MSTSQDFSINNLKPVDLFDGNNLQKLSNWSEISKRLGERHLLARPLASDDHNKGYVELLSKLTKVGDVDQVDFNKRFNLMRKTNEIQEHYMIVVIEDVNTKKIVAAATLFLELKFIHQCSIRGRLEDVIVDDTQRGKQIGLILVSIIVGLAKEVYKCYKLSLDCYDNLIEFYAKNNFKPSLNMLSIRFEDEAV